MVSGTKEARWRSVARTEAKGHVVREKVSNNRILLPYYPLPPSTIHAATGILDLHTRLFLCFVASLSSP